VRAVRGRRYLFYTNECVGLGHLRRTVSLAGAVCELDPSATALIITGSPVAPEQRFPPRVDTVKLPQLARDRTGTHRPHRLEGQLDRVRDLRARLALAAAEAFQPHVAVVDKTPLGLADELVPTLASLRRSTCRTVLGLRDVEDGAEAVRRVWDQDVREAVESYYDAVLVYGPEWTPDALTTLGWRDLSAEVHHVGYVGRPGRPKPVRDLEPGYLLVTAGGGADGFPLFAAALEAIALEPLDRTAVLVTGPLMAQRQVGRVRSLAEGLDVLVDEFRRDMNAVVEGASAVVAMAGYNTVVEVLRARKPALLVPRTEPSAEQLVRAQLVARDGLASMLRPDELSAPRLRRALDTLLASPPPEVDESLYDGATRAAEVLAELAGRPVATGRLAVAR
jgi:predicted glycosyltransferase